MICYGFYYQYIASFISPTAIHIMVNLMICVSIGVTFCNLNKIRGAYMHNRIDELDIIKGICIIGIVFNHAGHPLVYLSYFYLYGFYFVSGFTYHNKSFVELLSSKIRRIYIPFVFSNLFAELICVLLRKFTRYGGGVQLVSTFVFNFKI